MKIKVSPRAKARIRKEDTWWRENRRDAPDKFKQALANTFLRILKAPAITNPWAEVDGEPVWRIYMPETRHHLFYTVNHVDAVLVIRAVHGAQQGSPPELG